MAVTKHMMLRSWPGAARGRGDRQALCQRSAGLTPPGDVHRHCPDASPGGGRSQAVWPVLGNARPEPRFRCTRPTRDPRPPAERRRASLGGRAFLGLLPVGPGLSASDPFPAPCHRPRSQPALDRKRCTGPHPSTPSSARGAGPALRDLGADGARGTDQHQDREHPKGGPIAAQPAGEECPSCWSEGD
jgi:hypothetical protein